jgi:hypothetical protein
VKGPRPLIDRIVPLIALVLWALAANTAAHELRPGFLELREIDAGVYDLLWKVPARGDRRLSLNVRLPDHCEGTEPSSRFTGGAYVERWRARCTSPEGNPLGLAGGTVWIEGLAATRTDVLARVQRLDGGSQTVRLTPETDRFQVGGSASALSAAGTYTALGVEHILLGVDHLLFVLGLLWIVRGPWPLVKTITAFTIGHSISLAAATLGWIGVPEPPVNAAIALSIVFVAVEAIRVRRGEGGLTARWPWLVAFGFGLLHGLGFASALIKLGLPAGEVPLALLFFNLGVEIGQIAFVLLILALGASLRVLAVAWPRLGETLVIYGVGGIAAFWLIDRTVLMLAP